MTQSPGSARRLIPPSRSTRKPLIGLVIDSQTWAFAHIAEQLVDHLGARYRFRVIPTEVVDDVVQVLQMTADCDLTHFFWRGFLDLVLRDAARQRIKAQGFRDLDDFLKRVVAPRVLTTTVYDHLFLDPPAIEAHRALFTHLVAGYTVCSQRLMRRYERIAGYPRPAALTEDGVDLARFRPRNLDRLNSIGRRPLVIGWAGNSAWAREFGEDFKGLHTILKPAVQALQDEGLALRLELADCQQRLIPHHEMPAYYERLDLYVCPSKMEGTPNPVLEAMACGVPVISTDVGVVPQVLGADRHGLILPERSVAALRDRIRRFCLAGPRTAREISNDGLQKIKSWSWAHKVRPFERFFDGQLAARRAATLTAPQLANA